MALKSCGECGRQISTQAKSCPGCGAPNSPSSNKAEYQSVNTETPRKKISGLLVALIILTVIAIVGVLSRPDPIIQAKEAESAAKKEAECAQNLQCYGSKNVSTASVYCKDYIGRLAKYSMRWTDGTFESKFSRFKWLNKEKGTMTFVGDKAEFQNGFGAYQAFIYECDIDPSTHGVIDVRAYPGRL